MEEQNVDAEAGSVEESREGNEQMDGDHNRVDRTGGTSKKDEDSHDKDETKEDGAGLEGMDIQQRDIAVSDESMARKLFRAKMKADAIKRKQAREAWMKEMKEKQKRKEQGGGEEEETESCYVCKDTLPDEGRGIIRCVSSCSCFPFSFWRGVA